MRLFRQLVVLLGRGIGPSQGLPAYTKDNTTQKNADTHLCLEWDSNPRSSRTGMIPYKLRNNVTILKINPMSCTKHFKPCHAPRLRKRL